MTRKIRIGIMISGTGTNMQAIVNACQEGKINGEVVFVGADRQAKGIEWAIKNKIPHFVVDYQRIKKSYQGEKYFKLNCHNKKIMALAESVLKRSSYIYEPISYKAKIDYLIPKLIAEMELVRIIKDYKIDLLVLAGFMQVCTSYFIDEINNGDDDPRIMNIHPALLPSFPGVNGYGDTINYGCKFGGCTVHFVDYGEDTGPIIGQRAIPVLEGDDEELFKKRGLQEEYKLFPECIQLFAEGRLKVVKNETGRKVVLITETHNNPSC